MLPTLAFFNREAVLSTCPFSVSTKGYEGLFFYCELGFLCFLSFPLSFFFCEGPVGCPPVGMAVRRLEPHGSFGMFELPQDLTLSFRQFLIFISFPRV